MRLFALDLATKTGWASGTPEAQRGLVWGHIKLPSTGSDIGAFLAAYRTWLVGMIDMHQPDWIAFEAPVLPQQTSLNTVRKLQCLCGLTELIARDHKIDCTEANNQKVKVFFTGHGGKKGDRIIKSCNVRGWDTQDQDEADALAVWLYTLAQLDKLHGTKHANKFDPLFANA